MAAEAAGRRGPRRLRRVIVIGRARRTAEERGLLPARETGPLPALLLPIILLPAVLLPAVLLPAILLPRCLLPRRLLPRRLPRHVPAPAVLPVTLRRRLLAPRFRRRRRHDGKMPVPIGPRVMTRRVRIRGMMMMALRQRRLRRKTGAEG